jgi:tRNA G10  N-methylase Trm11
MTTFLLLLSLILNGAAIFAIILLYLRQNRLVEAEKKQDKIIKEIEEIFSAYLFELKEENDKFIQLMAETNTQEQPSIKMAAADASEKKDVRIKTAVEKPESDADNSNDIQQRLGKGISYHVARKAYQQNREQTSSVPDTGVELTEVVPEEDKEEFIQSSLFDQVLHMKNQGMTIEEIARKLDKGKTEIELLLKFRQNTQE